jgi:cell wall-associated NlpC family hydrolase
MSLTLTPPMRIFAFVGVLVAAGIAAFMFLVLRPGSGAEASSPTPVTRPAPVTTPAPKPRVTAPQSPASRPAAVRTKSGFPVPVHRALARNRVVVVVVYMPGARVDLDVRAAARAGASASGAGYVALSALSERLVRPLVAKTGVLPDPAVVIVKRPDVVTTTLSVTDRETVAQAVTQAKR